jgi:plasmid stabilization system protein ParE
MAYKLKYFDEVESDVGNAKEWYKEQREGLEKEFVSSVERTISLIVKNPKIFAERYKNVRIAITRRFPYNVVFYIDEANKTVVIIAVMHGRRHPKIVKKRRLKK